MVKSELITSFLQEADEVKLKYVHWKSNTNIDRALSGDDDLDLLIGKNEKEKLHEIFSKLNIIKVDSNKDKWQDGIENYIGFDTFLNKLIHFHIHYSLPVGYDFDKNFILPVEEEYLLNTQKYQGIYLPSYENEYILLVIRLILKNGLTPFSQHLFTNKLKIIKQSKTVGIINGGGYREFLDLRNKVKPSKVEYLINERFNFISLDTFNVCEKALISNNSLKEFFKACSTLEHELGDFKNNNALKSYLLSFARINSSRIKGFRKKLFKYNVFGKKPANGGRIFAFVGGDGAGKSTTIENLSKTLSRHFRVHEIHVGRPRKCFLGISIKVLKRIANPFIDKDLSLSLSFLALAFDRRKEFQRACKLRNKGAIVLLDRIPLNGITSMDCPRIRLNFGSKYESLSKLEEKLYREIVGVDQLFVLKLNPKIALKRRPEDEPNELLQRSGQIWNNEWNAPYAIEINTGEISINDVQSVILSNVNRCLCKRFKLVEIAGVNGTGKSTLIKNVNDRNGNVRNSLPVKDYKFLLLISIFISIPWAIKSYIKTKNKLVVLNVIGLFSSTILLEYWRVFNNQPSTSFILDQGPFFQLSLMKKEKILNVDVFNKVINKNIESIVLLTAEVDLLWDRVIKRENHTCRAQNLNKHDFIKFCEDYELAISIINHKNIFKVDTSNINPIELYQLLSKREVIL